MQGSRARARQPADIRASGVEVRSGYVDITSARIVRAMVLWASSGVGKGVEVAATCWRSKVG